MSTSRIRLRSRVVAGIIVAVAAALLAACSTSSDPSGSDATPPGATHNAADVMFNTMMIPHHRQAVEMADLVDGRTTDPRVVKLAGAIKAAQQPEIDQMTARLKSWGVEPDGPGHGMGGHEMGGMMSDAEMAAMRDASGAQFDRLWLQGMIAHHEGAIAMADTELADGTDPASKELARQIKSGQQAEIEQMRLLLK